MHHEYGDFWVSCTPDVTSLGLEQAFFDAIVQQYKTNKPCWVNQQRGRGIFRHTERLRQPKEPKRKKFIGTDASAGPLFYS